MDETGSIFGSRALEEFVRETMPSQDIASEIIASLGSDKALEVAADIIRLTAPAAPISDAVH
jgi:hypothetical protein